MSKTDHLDPFAVANRNVETSTARTTIRAGVASSDVVAMASPAVSLAAFPPSMEKTMPDTHATLVGELPKDFEEQCKSLAAKFNAPLPAGDGDAAIIEALRRINDLKPAVKRLCRDMTFEIEKLVVEPILYAAEEALVSRLETDLVPQSAAVASAQLEWLLGRCGVDIEKEYLRGISQFLKTKTQASALDGADRPRGISATPAAAPIFAMSDQHSRLDDDQTLRELLALRQTAWIADNQAEDEFEESMQSETIEARIMAQPASGAVGMAVKIYLLAHTICGAGAGLDGLCVCGFDGGDYSSDGPDGTLYEQRRWLKSLAADAARFTPELAPLLMPISAAPDRLGDVTDERITREVVAKRDARIMAERERAAGAKRILPFVTDRLMSGRCNWDIRPTDDFNVDCDTGARFALDYLQFVRAGNMLPLQFIVDAMARQHMDDLAHDDKRWLGGVEVGFLTIVLHAAAWGFHSAEERVAVLDMTDAQLDAARRQERMLSAKTLAFLKTWRAMPADVQEDFARMLDLSDADRSAAFRLLNRFVDRTLTAEAGNSSMSSAIAAAE